MSTFLQKSVAVGLTVCLLLLSGLVYVQAMEHAAHHAHHQAATHASALCSWMCAAGQSLEGITVAFHADLSPLALVDPPAAQDLLTTVLPSPVTRGPPSFTV
ncbi:MAG: hypothetical protein FJ249_00185 [Nitrospira sp.]|nr:hypothetical protein [Nitrospira sp.]